MKHKLLLTVRQVSKFRKAFAYNSSVGIKLSKTQIPRIIQLGRFLGRLLGPLIKVCLPLIKNLIKPSANRVLIPLGFTAADADIHKKSWFGNERIDNFK